MSKKSLNVWPLLTFLLIGTIVGYFATGFAPGSSEKNVPSIVVSPEPDAAPEPELVVVSIDDDAQLGDPDAPVTIVEFSDFQCSFCRRSYNDMLPLLKENYIDKGLVNFVYRDFPLTSIHGDAQKAAEAAECAEEQGQFWEMHDAIFDGQNALGSGTVRIPEDDLKQYAVDLGLDAVAFNDCLDSDKYADEVSADIQDGRAYGVSATPTFFVNGYPVVGAQSYSTISAIIDDFLEN